MVSQWRMGRLGVGLLAGTVALAGCQGFEDATDTLPLPARELGQTQAAAITAAPADSIANDEGFTLVDAVGTAVVFKFSKDQGATTESDVTIPIWSGQVATQVATAIKLAVSSHSGFSAAQSVGVVTVRRAMPEGEVGQGNTDTVADSSFVVRDFVDEGVAKEQLVFMSMRDEEIGGEIYRMHTDGSGLVRLTRKAGRDGDPVFSPDGTRIAFVSARDGNLEVYVMNVDGTVQTNLTGDPNADTEPAWSPDGSQIAFASLRRCDQDAQAFSGQGKIFVMNADGSGGAVALTCTDFYDSEPTWSPDGTRIAFVRDLGAGNTEIFSIHSDGTALTQLTDDPAADQSPAWSPDGTRIALSSNRNGATFHLFLMDPDGTAGPVQLTKEPVFESDSLAPAWSPDGTWLVFVRLLPGGNLEISLLDLERPDEPVLLVADPSTDTSPSWSP